MTLTEDISAAVAAMRAGGVIIYPTDTVWGIGCDASSAEAVARIFRIKKRADSKALITLVSSAEMLRRHTAHIPEGLDALLAESDRPTTIIYPEGHGVTPLLLASDGSIGMRITSEKYSAALCEALGGPIVSTSANISGEPTPSLFTGICPEILQMVDYVASYRRDDMTPAIPSRIMKISKDGIVQILRP